MYRGDITRYYVPQNVSGVITWRHVTWLYLTLYTLSLLFIHKMWLKQGYQKYHRQNRMCLFNVAPNESATREVDLGVRQCHSLQPCSISLGDVIARAWNVDTIRLQRNWRKNYIVTSDAPQNADHVKMNFLNSGYFVIYPVINGQIMIFDSFNYGFCDEFLQRKEFIRKLAGI